MKTKFACSHCDRRHEEKTTVTLRHADGVLVYGIDCVREMATAIDAMASDEAADELMRNEDPLREIFLVQRTEGMRCATRLPKRRVVDLNMYLVQGGKRG